MPFAFYSSLDATLHALVGQRQALLGQQLESEAIYLDRLRKLHAAESEMREAARRYDSFLEKHLFWLGTQSRTQPDDVLRLPDEVRLLLAPARRSDLVRAFEQQVLPSPVFWMGVLLALVLTLAQGVLTAAIERTARHVGEPGADSFRHTLRALGWTLLQAAPLPLLLAVTSGLLQGNGHGTALSHTVGAGLQAVALNLYVLVALRQISLPGGLARMHLQWPEPAAHQLRVELGRLLWVFIPANIVGDWP